jgi:hypothetical protein
VLLGVTLDVVGLLLRQPPCGNIGREPVRGRALER